MGLYVNLKRNFILIQYGLLCDLNTLYNEICEGNPHKSKYKFDNRLEWGLKQK